MIVENCYILEKMRTMSYIFTSAKFLLVVSLKYTIFKNLVNLVLDNKFLSGRVLENYFFSESYFSANNVSIKKILRCSKFQYMLQTKRKRICTLI
jgi:hypothetical protein